MCHTFIYTNANNIQAIIKFDETSITVIFVNNDSMKGHFHELMKEL